MPESAEKIIHTKTTDEGYHRDLGYDEEFKKVIRENPGVIKNFLEAMNALGSEREGNIITKGNVTVELVYAMGRVDVYKVEIAGKTYAVRKTERYGQVYSNKEKGVKQFKDSLRAREILKDISGVEVQEAYLGYDDKGNGRRFFVSQWYDLYDLDYYVHIKKETADHGMIQGLESRAREIQSALKGYSDVVPHNMFYDEARDTIILFDLHDKSEEVN